MRGGEVLERTTVIRWNGIAAARRRCAAIDARGCSSGSPKGLAGKTLARRPEKLS
jgi:hypothetical protein